MCTCDDGVVHPVIEQFWAIGDAPTWQPETAIESARDLWQQQGYRATWAAAMATLLTVDEMVGERPDDHQVAVRPEEPPTEVLRPIGDLRRAKTIAYETWNWIAGMLASHDMEVADPYLEETLKAISSDFKGNGVYMYSWWTRSALSRISDRAAGDDDFMASWDRLEERLSSLGNL